ncbi:MAG: hypothetical protein Q8R35_03115 [bacterium]|nr:hypothetical protein [bacterium]
MGRKIGLTLAAVVLAAVHVFPAAAEPADARLKALIEGTYTLSSWTFRQPPSFELPDASDQPRSLSRDFRGQVVLVYLFAEW